MKREGRKEQVAAEVAGLAAAWAGRPASSRRPLRECMQWAIALGAMLGTVVRADDWPAWGGSDPGRNMYSPAKGIPTFFGPKEPNKPGKFEIEFKKNSEEIDMAKTKNVKLIAKLG